MRVFFLSVIWCCWAAVLHAQPVTARTGNPPKAFTAWKQSRPNPYLADTLMAPIPLAHALFHDKIDNEQRKADEADGKADDKITVAGAANAYTRALIQEIDALQILVENLPIVARDSNAHNQLQIQCLRALWELMRQYNGDPKPRPGFYDSLATNMHHLIVAVNEHKEYDFVVAHCNLYTLDNARLLLEKQSPARELVYSRMGAQYPVRLVQRLEEFAKDTFAPPIIAAAARLEPSLIFNYALSSNLLLKGAVYKTHDPYVQAIVQAAAESDAPLRALPFVSYLYTGSMGISGIDSIAADPARSYNALAELRRSREPLSKKLYTSELEYRTLKFFVRQMNELHDTTDAVRFACTDSLPATSLYYVMIYGREEIYTSSFLGTFKRMMERMPPMRANVFLDSLHYDYFRTFIRLCAAYNTLSEFLGAMDDTARTTIMTRFINGLEEGPADELEDAVNVADAIGSINDPALIALLRGRIIENYKKCKYFDNKKGVAIYGLLSLLAESATSSNAEAGAATASAKLKLPPINVVPYNELTNDTGTVYERVFFYGDDDGRNAWEGFTEEYRKNPKWQVDTTHYMTTVTSLTGQRIVMYANNPLRTPEDEQAIDTVDQFLAAAGIHPRVVIHRGHSYHVKATLARIDSNARIVVLGSCGGYQNVTKVLRSAPSAHIISSKQTGVGAINEPIVRAINTSLLEKTDINWINIWNGLEEYFVKKPELYPRYRDYVPPHKNLGVLFIKAYHQMLNSK